MFDDDIDDSPIPPSSAPRAPSSSHMLTHPTKTTTEPSLPTPRTQVGTSTTTPRCSGPPNHSGPASGSGTTIPRTLKRPNPAVNSGAPPPKKKAARKVKPNSYLVELPLREDH